MHPQQALRSISLEAIPEALVYKILDAGIRAPSGGNPQC
jgi:hypothetical protein